MTTQVPYHWIKTIERAAEELKIIPLFGNPPPFPWENFSRRLSDTLKIHELKIREMRSDWKEEKDLLQGLGKNTFVIPLEMTPLEGKLFWVMALEDILKLTSHSVEQQSRPKGFSDPRFQEGFYHYLSLEALSALDNLTPFSDLTLRRGSTAELPQDGGLCMDISLSFDSETLWGRLICTREFLHDYRSYFAQMQPSSLSPETLRQIEVTLRFQVGNVELSEKEWARVKTGDMVLLDRCTYDPDLGKGTALILLEKTPLLRARIKENTIKILDVALYYEENSTMKDDFSGDEETGDSDRDEEEDFPIDNEEEFPEESEEMENEEQPWKSEGTDVSEKLIAHKDIPLMLSVEVTRVKISLEKLMQLQPGNLIDLSILPEQGVDLTVNGKRVAKGELVKVGDMLGVKILRIGENGR